MQTALTSLSGRVPVLMRWPSSNFNGNCEPYLAGTPSNGGICGKCGGADSDLCDDGLCTNYCPYENRYKDCDERFPDAESCNDATNPNSPNRPGCEATCNCRSTEQIYWIN
ncbi:hypothetical protein BV898_09103 [Hypsibius exemplaris]|uniref:Cysteine-rich secretory protein domain-containing protein n=1 Tax=Hypsibius exemplaris TaxID=2072580 RepID=A0A1W0WNH2_HYPEX|nr:hypothetical protein BV898_09103 [Hypsibius exemplaris]